MSILKLENLEFYAYHGCREHENTNGNTFLVSVALSFDSSKAELTDNLECTIDCQQIYDIIKTQMNKPSKLIENLARRILDAIKANFSEITQLTVSVSKLNPPLGGKAEKTTFELSDGNM
ncbi:MAG: dihydroneopterin aldolase [Paludibacter sp.]|jgi:dihydroneopterin aldolase|nr:dihydroneopterin aldolase [Paludibacter sp.]